MRLIFGAIGLSQPNWVSPAIVLVFPSAALLDRIHVAETALTEACGEGYVEHTKATRRLVPGIY
jgi:protein-S-isoprenylcysteine O-methyltransferase Ste14